MLRQVHNAYTLYTVYAIIPDMKTDAFSLPFSLNRNLRTPLSTQLADGLRKAILSGHYRPGDILPSYQQLAQALGVSLRVPREAMADLVARNLVNPRPRVGCEVLPRGATVQRGRVLVVMPGDSFVSYHSASLIEAFRVRMTDAGWLVQVTTFDRTAQGRTNYAALDDALGQRHDYAFLIHATTDVFKRIAAAGIPAISFDSDAGHGVRDDVRLSFDAALDRLLPELRARASKDILLLEYKPYPRIHERLRQAGIFFTSRAVPWMTGRGYLEKIVRAGFALSRDCLKGTKRKTGLLFFTDDFVARGGLCAVQSCGLSVPKNLQIVTFTNKGYAPIFPVELTRLEADPFRLAQLTADEVLRRLAGSPPQSVIGEVGYIPGSTLRR